VLYTTTATFGSDGWNGVSGLSGWTVGAGSYWVEFEIQGEDTLGDSTPVMDVNAPNPVAVTATTPDSGFTYQTGAQSIGLRVDASVLSAVPEPAAALQVVAGGLLLASLSLVRRRRG
jgi:hypothetical protein